MISFLYMHGPILTTSNLGSSMSWGKAIATTDGGKSRR